MQNTRSVGDLLC